MHWASFMRSSPHHKSVPSINLLNRKTNSIFNSNRNVSFSETFSKESGRNKNKTKKRSERTRKETNLFRFFISLDNTLFISFMLVLCHYIYLPFPFHFAAFRFPVFERFRLAWSLHLIVFVNDITDKHFNEIKERCNIRRRRKEKRKRKMTEKITGKTEYFT